MRRFVFAGIALASLLAIAATTTWACQRWTCHEFMGRLTCRCY